jgi:hypothetical protein
MNGLDVDDLYFSRDVMKGWYLIIAFDGNVFAIGSLKPDLGNCAHKSKLVSWFSQLRLVNPSFLIQISYWGTLGNARLEAGSLEKYTFHDLWGT